MAASVWPRGTDWMAPPDDFGAVSPHVQPQSEDAGQHRGHSPQPKEDGDGEEHDKEEDDR